MKKLKLATTLLGLSILLFSCNKTEPIPPPEHTSDLGGLFEDNVTNAIQLFSVDAGTWQEFTGSNGVKVTIPANSFEYANGNIVTGTIDFELIEVLDQSSMILLNKPTTSNGEILVSGGEIKLTASQNGTTVYLADNATISIQVPTDAPTGQMGLFTGIEDAEGNVEWVENTTDSSLVVVQDSAGGNWSEYYYFEWPQSDSALGWINCDYFWNNPNPSTTVSIITPEDYDYSNTAVFLHFSTINSIMGCYWDGTDSFDAANIPTGTTATAVCISEIDGDYYSNFTPISVTANYSVTVTMNSTTYNDIVNDINNL